MRNTTNEKRACPTTSRPATTNGGKHTSAVARGASPARRFGPNIGESIIIALAFGTAARMAGRAGA